MKITKVEVIELRLPEKDVTDKASAAQDASLIKIYTDEDIVGIGEANSSPHMVRAAIEAPLSSVATTGLGRLLIGMDPLDIDVVIEKLYHATFYCGRRGLVVHTIAGIDIALWDIAGKVYQQPVYKLLGGAFNKKVRAYASDLFGKDGKATREKAKKWMDQGFTAVKFGWAPMGQNEKLDIELVEGARLGMGDKNDILIDAGCCWDTRTAMARARQFEPYRPGWLEEPLDQDNWEGYQALRKVSKVPIAAGEGEAGVYAWKDLIERECVDICQIDLARNGFTWSKRIADMAESHGLKVVNHFYSTPINLVAGLHWLVTRKSAFILEYCVEDTPMRKEVTNRDILAVDGYVTVPEEPGIGLSLNDDVVNKYCVGRGIVE